MKRIIGRCLTACFALIALVSGCQCGPDHPDDIRIEKLMILWSNGFNSLSKYLKEDINDLQGGYLPFADDKNVVIVVSHLPRAKGDYRTETAPQLIRLYRDKKTNKAVMDTLKSYSTDLRLGDASTMRTILNEIHSQFNAKHYGMVFSSHSTGWLPKGYYSDPESFDEITPSSARVLSLGQALPEGAVRYIEEQRLPGEPAVKSLGSTVVAAGSSTVAYEADLAEFANALPFHFDYIIFDSCLTGCIEVAYQLRNATDILCFSPAEVLAQGLDYTRLSQHLLANEKSDVNAVADDYYSYYANKSDLNERAATVTVVRCGEIEPVAVICRELFAKYKSEIGSLNTAGVQRYYRTYHHWFYDLEDILLKAGITADEKAELEGALNKCVTYKAATESYLPSFGGFDIKIYSGFSMYLPCDGSSYLDAFYKSLDWNMATELVD